MPFGSPYQIDDISQIPSPSLIVFRDLVEQNLLKMIEIAGSVTRLRPHCKTHKMPAIIKWELSLGITKHKCATIAEAEMLATAGANDILLAYNIVGPNVQRMVKLIQRFPKVTFAVTADHPHPLRELSLALTEANAKCRVLLDVETGMGRTGIEMGDAAIRLYDEISRSDGIIVGGLHLYDGHHRQSDPGERTSAVRELWKRVTEFRKELNERAFDVPKIVAGGTGSFPMWAEIDDPILELSPGTPVFYDAGYTRAFPDLPFVPAAAVLTRVMSRPSPDRVTFDLGHKAVAADPPAGNRSTFPAIPDAKELMQSEEHLVLQTESASRWQPGDATLAIPIHICPTTALHEFAYVVSQNQIVDQYPVTSRTRCITI
jgi:D-threonine aldolase